VIGSDPRRAQRRATLPIRRVVSPGDVAALAVHRMIDTALTGATYDIDGDSSSFQLDSCLFLRRHALKPTFANGRETFSCA
jgi:hypothetical protein